MSPNVGNFVHDLVEMAKAMETLPLVQHDLDEANVNINRLHDQIQRLELRLNDRNSEIDHLHATIRELEVAKDQAETMFLEADERTGRALDFIKTSFGAAGSLIQALEPVKAVPEPVKFDDGGPYNEPQGQSEPSPTASSEVHSQSVSSTTEPIAAPTTSASQGESAADPTATVLTPVTESVPTGSSVKEGVGETDKPFANMNYYDYPTYMPIEKWLEGGGTEESYYWRPSANRA